MNRIRNVGVGFVTSLVLAACGGGGGGGGSAIPDQALGGIWIGTGTNSLDPGVVLTVVAISTDDGEFRFITDVGVQSVGELSANGQNFTGTSVDYAPLGNVFSNGLPVTTGTYTGTIVERQSMDGEWGSGTSESGDFVLVYDDLYDADSSLATVSGTYTTYDEFGIADGTVTVSNSGAITGSDTSGCIYGGNIQIIDSRYNAYRLNVTAANCGSFDGSYTGLGAYDSADGSLTFQVDNTNYIITNVIYK